MTQTSASVITGQIPIVDYLVLRPEPHLRAHECASCAARYFDRRNACAHCSGTRFADVDVPTAGVLSTYTIVTFAPPGVDAPFVAAIVDCGGTSVRGKLLNVTPAPGNIALGMPLRLATYSLGADSGGVEAIGYGFEPAGPPAGHQASTPADGKDTR
jgi:uncharacterized OB-fold protein